MRVLALFLLLAQSVFAQDTLDWDLSHPEWSIHQVGVFAHGGCLPGCCGNIDNPPEKRWEDWKYFRIRARVDSDLRSERPDLFDRCLESGQLCIMPAADTLLLPITAIRVSYLHKEKLREEVERLGDAPFEFVARVNSQLEFGAYILNYSFEARMMEPRFRKLE